jgi:hypothetical protein
MAAISSWPIAVWVLLVAAAVFAARVTFLVIQRWRYLSADRQAERKLLAVAAALKRYAEEHDGDLPEKLTDLGWPADDSVAYRPVPRIDLDEKLILACDARPGRKVIEFPMLRDGRGVVFCSGRFHVATEAAFEKMIAADDRLRERLAVKPCLGSKANPNGDRQGVRGM